MLENFWGKRGKKRGPVLGEKNDLTCGGAKKNPKKVNWGSSSNGTYREIKGDLYRGGETRIETTAKGKRLRFNSEARTLSEITHKNKGSATYERGKIKKGEDDGGQSTSQAEAFKKNRYSKGCLRKRKRNHSWGKDLHPRKKKT